MRILKGQIPLLEVPKTRTDDQITDLNRLLRPVMKTKLGYREIKTPKSLFTFSYIWDPKLNLPILNLEKVDEFYTVHGYGYPGFFKPSIAEVLQQIPEKYTSDYHYYEIAGPECADDLNQWKKQLNAGVHVAIATVFREARHDK